MGEVLLWNYVEPLVIRSFAAGKFPDLYALRDYVEDINSANNASSNANTSSSCGLLMLLPAATGPDARPIILTGANYSDIQGGTILYLPWTDLNIDVRSPFDSSVTVPLAYGVTDNVQILRQRVATSMNIHEKYFDLVYNQRVLIDDELVIDICRPVDNSCTLQNHFSDKQRVRDVRSDKPEHRPCRINKAEGLAEVNGNHCGPVVNTRNPAESNNAKPSACGPGSDSAEERQRTIDVMLQASQTVTLNIRTFWHTNHYVRVSLGTRVASIVELVLSQTFRNKAALSSHSRLLAFICRLEHPDGTLLNNNAFLVDCLSLEAQATYLCDLNLQQVTAKTGKTRTVLVKSESTSGAELCRVPVTSNAWLAVALHAHCVSGLPVDCLTLQHHINGNISTVNVWSSIGIQKSEVAIVAVLCSGHNPPETVITPARAIDIVVSVPHMPSFAFRCDLGETVTKLKDRLKVKGITDAHHCSVYHKQVRLLDASFLAHYDTLADSLAFELRRVDVSANVIIGKVAKRVTVDCGLTVKAFADHVRKTLRKSKLLPDDQLADISLVHCGRVLNVQEEMGGVTVGEILSEDSQVFVLLSSQRSICHQMRLLNTDSTTADVGSLRTSQQNNSNNSTNKPIVITPTQQHSQTRREPNFNLLAFLRWKYQLSIVQRQSTPNGSAHCTVDGSIDLSHSHSGSQHLSACDEATDQQMIGSSSIASRQDADNSFVVLTVKQFYHNIFADDPYLLWYWNKTLY